jgi:excisionase family DNA binding protein
VSLFDEGALRALLAEEVRRAVREEMGPIADALRSEVQAALTAVREALPTKLVGIRQAAEALGVSLSTIHRRVKDGSLRSIRIGAAVRVDLSALRSPVEIAEATRLEVANARRASTSAPRASNGVDSTITVRHK